MMAKTALIALIAAGSLAGVFALYLLIVATAPGMSVPKQPIYTEKQPPEKADGGKPSPARQEVSFRVDGSTLKAWLYLPRNSSSAVPCIVMGHGFGGTMEMGLARYAERFQSAGFAALAFDYRHFGASGGEPRQLVWIPHQIKDWKAAIEFARSLPQIDPARIGLWGTSLSGGHVIVAAAGDPNIACVSAQCPGLDGRKAAEKAFARHGIGHGLRMLAHGQRDLVRSWLGLSPHRIPIFGRPGTIACFTTPDACPAAQRLAGGAFVNEVCARINIRGDKYRPVTSAGSVECPVLIQVCENDLLVPPVTLEESIERLGALAEVIRYPIGHFDIYFDEHFEIAAADQLAFFQKHLL